MSENKAISSAPGDVSWNYCLLTNSNDSAVDILGLIGEIDLFEDIFSPVMYASMTIVDTHNLINSFPIVGQEKVFMSFRTPNQREIKKAFRVVKVSPRVIQSNKQNYVLSLISFDGFIDSTYSCSRAYRGTPDQIINKVIDEMYEFSPIHEKHDTTPQREIEEAGNQIKVVSANWSPIKLINFCVKRALNNRQIADFLYYESSQGIRFKSLTQHLFQQEAIDFLTYDHSRSSDPEVGGFDIQNSYMKIHDLRYVDSNDILNTLMNHGFGHTTYTHNMLNKTYREESIEKEDLFNVNEVPVLNTYEMFNLAEQDFKIKNSAYFTVVNKYPRMFDDVIEDNTDQTKLTRAPTLNKLELNKMNIDIWGRTTLEVGNCIYIALGKYTSGKDAAFEGNDKNSSSKYLVTAIRHRLTSLQHKMTLQCVRDSLLNPSNPV